MKSTLSYGTASVALIMSLMGTANAQEAEAPEAFIEPELVLEVADKEDADEDEIYGPQAVVSPLNAGSDLSPQGLDAAAFNHASLALQNNAAVPTDLLSAFNAIDGGLIEAPLAPVSLDAPSFNGDDTITLRSIESSSQEIDPFYGTIRPFYGDITAFWGTIHPFYGDIVAFDNGFQTSYGDISPFWGDIVAFWGTIRPFWGDIVAFENHMSGLGTFWQSHFNSVDLVESRFNDIKFYSNGSIVRDGSPDRMMAALREMIAEGKARFGAAYTKKTGKSFDVLVDQVFAKYGADPDKKATVEILSKRDRALLYLDWHDALMSYSDVDIVDHWMPAINWAPSITQIQGSGADTIIGVIDGDFSSTSDLSDNVIYSGGFFNPVGGHGAGVVSLIAGAHDGQGVMGIAPNVNIATYNPFNAEGRTNAAAVANGLLALQNMNIPGLNQTGRASIVNLSLGHKGWVFSQAMSNLFSRTDIAAAHDNTVYVIAAGNSGITQTQNVNWGLDYQWVWDANEWEWEWTGDAAMIFVGAVDPNGEIASYSNRPGTACILRNGQCYSGNQLFMRTVVAPGTLLAVSDGQGGVTRASGTSFAAPLVSGAISLLHDRWQWLAEHPHESAEIIFRSARDLGAPGPDPVYGWGLLDVAASQSPLDFNTMQFRFHESYSAGGFTGRSTRTMSPSSVLQAGSFPRNWDLSEVYLVAFENIGNTHRDFIIPLAGLQNGASSDALGRGQERFQDYVTQRFSRWLQSGGADRDGDGQLGFSEVQSDTTDLNGEWSFKIDAVAPQFNQDGTMRMVHGAATIVEPSGKASFTVGHGQGSMALSSNGFGIISDHDPVTGGVNPVLGFASGDTFVQAAYQILPNTKVSFGFSENRDRFDDRGNLPEELALQRQLQGERPANAFTFDIAQKVSDDVSVSVQYTMLDEETSMLGMQGGNSAFMTGGAATEAMSVSAAIDLGDGFAIDVSATGARTETSRDQLFTNNGAVWSTAGQFSATKRGLFSKKDALRLSVAQPLQIEDGSLQFTTDQVIDRTTGEIGPVTQTFGIETQRRITGEAVYAMQLTNSSEFSAFSRYTSAGDTFDEAGFVVGGNFSIRF